MFHKLVEVPLYSFRTGPMVVVSQGAGGVHRADVTYCIPVTPGLSCSASLKAAGAHVSTARSEAGSPAVRVHSPPGPLPLAPSITVHGQREKKTLMFVTSKGNGKADGCNKGLGVIHTAQCLIDL